MSTSRLQPGRQVISTSNCQVTYIQVKHKFLEKDGETGAGGEWSDDQMKVLRLDNFALSRLLY